MYSENEDFEEEYNVDTSNNQSFGDKVKEFYEANKKLCIIAGGFFLLLLILLMMNSCSNNNENPTGSGGVAGGSGESGGSTDSGNIEMNLTSTEEHLSIGNSVRLKLYVDVTYDVNPVWISSDPSVATVDQLGNVSALKLGNTTITVSFKLKDNKMYKLNCKIIVAEGNEDVTITNVSFPEGELLMTFGDKYQLLKQITPSNGYITDITYTSSNQSVATVDNQGVVKALKKGVTTIKMYVNNSTFTDELIVNVVEENVEPQMIIYPTNITFDNQNESLVVGSRKQLNYQYLPKDAYVKNLEWSSSNTSIVTVDSEGEITAIKEGSAIITVKSKDGVSATVNVTILPDKIDVTAINLLSASYITLDVGGTSQIITNVLPSNATDKSVTYTSSNQSVATVDSNGLIRAISSGATNITIKTNDKGYTKSVVVYVNTSSSGGSTGGDSGSSGGNSGSGSSGTTTTCTSDTLITISSDSGGAIMKSLTNAQNSSVSVTKNKVTVKTNQIGDSSCGTIKNLKYCYQTYNGYNCIPSTSFSVGDDIVLNIPNGNGILHFRIQVTMNDGTVYTKNYYIKNNVSSSSSNTIGCYCCGNSQGCTYSWGTGGSSCTINPNITESACVGQNPINITLSRTIETNYSGYALTLLTLNTSNYLKSINYCVNNQKTCSVAISGLNSTSGITYNSKKYLLLTNNQTYTSSIGKSGKYDIRIAVKTGDYFCYVPRLADGNYGTQKCAQIG